MTLGIVDLLLRPRWSDAHRAVLGRALTELPWCWPREARGREGLAFERAAQEFSPDPERPGPPPMRTGAFPIVTASGSAACLWTVAPSTVPAPGAVDRPLVGRALQAHDAARRALPDSLPLLWRSLQDADLRDKPLRLVAKLAHGQTDVPEHTIDGLSCGLSLYLTMASLVFRQALPHDAAASAQVDPVGRLEGVGRLPEKIELLARWAPRIGRLLVFEDQVDEARAAAGGRIEIVGVETAAEAVGEVWGGPEVVARWLVHEGRTPERRKELVDQFFRICVSGRDTLPDWNPLHRAAAVVVDAWQEQLSPVELAPLVFARAVAGRREGHTDARVALPDCEWIDDLPLDTRLLVVAHHIQHAADIGTPSFEAAGQLYERYARRGRDAHTLHFAIHGAYGPRGDGAAGRGPAPPGGGGPRDGRPLRISTRLLPGGRVVPARRRPRR